MSSSVRSFERGSSLLEIVVATAIFAFLVLSLSPSVLSSRKSAALSRNTSSATALALDKLEQLRAVASSHAHLASGTHNDALNPLRVDGTTGGIYTRSWTVTNDTPEVGMKRVEMKVNWKDRIGANSITLVSLVLP